jgi:prevent-host-death family protein
MCYHLAVENIGIRELRQHASKWIAKAKAGATIQITDRGQPVARLVPISRTEQTREALIADGLLIPAPNARTTLNPDELIQGPSLSRFLDEMRSDR